jgi:hypothetical protein
LEIVRKEQEETNRNKRGSSKGGQSSYAKLKMQLETNQYQTTQVQIELQDTQRIKLVCEDELVKVRIDVVRVRMELQELTMKNEEYIKGMENEMRGLKRAMGLHTLHIEKLKATITADDIRYDSMVARVEQSQ